MKDGEATVSAGKTAFFPARAGALMGLLAATGLLSLPLHAAFDPPDTPSAAALPVIDRNFAGVVAVGDDDVLKVAEARLVRVAEGAPSEPNPAARAGEGLGTAPEPWPARELSLMERVQDWLARANREFQTVIVRRLSVAPPGGGGDDIAKKLEQVKDEDAEAAQAQQAAEPQRRKEAADALKEETRKERERLAAESKRAAEARLAEEAQRVVAKKAAEEAAVREAARKDEAERQARAAEARERAEKVAEDQKRHREEEHQRALADAASKAADAAKRAEEAAELQAKRVAAEAQRRAEQEAAQAAAAKEAEEKARAAAAARDAERERIAREDAEKAAQANAARAKLAEERAKQDAAAREAADRQRAADDAARAAALKAAQGTAKTATASPVAKAEAPVAFELRETRTVREARNTRLARGPVVQPWMRRVRHERQGRCENAGRRISLPGHYVVARGDTLWQIALRHYRSGLYFMRIYRANRDVIRNPNVIYACERLYLPRR